MVKRVHKIVHQTLYGSEERCLIRTLVRLLTHTHTQTRHYYASVCKNGIIYEESFQWARKKVTAFPTTILCHNLLYLEPI